MAHGDVVAIDRGKNGAGVDLRFLSRKRQGCGDDDCGAGE